MKRRRKPRALRQRRPFRNRRDRREVWRSGGPGFSSRACFERFARALLGDRGYTVRNLVDVIAEAASPVQPDSERIYRLEPSALEVGVRLHIRAGAIYLGTPAMYVEPIVD